MSHGTFTKDGHAARVAYSPGEAVSLAFDGWSETPVEEIKGAALDAALAAEGESTAGSVADKRDRLTKS